DIRTLDGVLENLEQLVGRPEEGGGPAGGSTTIGKALTEATKVVTADREPRLAEVAHRVLAEPQFRLTGVEQAVQERIGDALTENIRHHKAEADKLIREAVGLYRQTDPLLETLRKGSLWGWGRKSRAAADFLELLQRYAATRCGALTHQAVSA